LGRAVVAEFARRGWDAISPARTDLDLASKDSILSYCAAQSKHGKFDALVHSAGVNWPRPLGQTSEDEWQLTLQVNLTEL
jgi:NAD(P)-dependent dehydrogenase (short-subunit alcohol dehydrogenase family)